MADVNWTQYRCNICLMLGLAVSAVVAGLIGWLLLMAGLPVVLAILLFVVVWAVLGYLVDQQCPGLMGAGSPAGDVSHSPAADEPDAEALTADRAAAEDAAKREAEERAEAERLAAEEAVRKEAADRTAAEAARAAEEADRNSDGVVAGENAGTRPEILTGPRGGEADDLKKIKGIGPKLERLCNTMGFYHFDQIAAWTEDEIAWVDSNLEGFRGRVTRDKWVAQARLLAGGGETALSKRVDDGDVPSSQ